MIQIKIASSAQHYTDCETIAMCGGYSPTSELIYVASARSGEQGQGEAITLQAQDAHHIEVVVYFVPKALPKGKNIPIKSREPFEANITISQGTRELYYAEHDINAWGGAAIKLNFEL
ncbi:MAG: hypothetical protein SNH94_03735 [Rikenellaceae bacterium]